MKNFVQKIVVGAAVFKDGRILILQRSKDDDIFPNLWELPSGKREPMEKAEEALVREVREETGLVVKPLFPFSVFDYQIKKTDCVKDTTQIDFLVRPVGSLKVKLSVEHQNFAWIKRNEINNYTISENIKIELEKAFKLAPVNLV